MNANNNSQTQNINISSNRQASTIQGAGAGAGAGAGNNNVAPALQPNSAMSCKRICNSDNAYLVVNKENPYDSSKFMCYLNNDNDNNNGGITRCDNGNIPILDDRSITDCSLNPYWNNGSRNAAQGGQNGTYNIIFDINNNSWSNKECRKLYGQNVVSGVGKNTNICYQPTESGVLVRGYIPSNWNDDKSDSILIGQNNVPSSQRKMIINQQAEKQYNNQKLAAEIASLRKRISEATEKYKSLQNIADMKNAQAAAASIKAEEAKKYALNYANQNNAGSNSRSAGGAGSSGVGVVAGSNGTAFYGPNKVKNNTNLNKMVSNATDAVNNANYLSLQAQNIKIDANNAKISAEKAKKVMNDLIDYLNRLLEESNMIQNNISENNLAELKINIGFEDPNPFFGDMMVWRGQSVRANNRSTSPLPYSDHIHF